MTNNLCDDSTLSVLNHWTSYLNNKHQNFSFEIWTRLAQYEKSFIFYFVLLFSYSDFVLGIHINTSANNILAIYWQYQYQYWKSDWFVSLLTITAQSTAVSVKPPSKVDLEIKVEVKISLVAEFQPEMRWVSCQVMITLIWNLEWPNIPCSHCNLDWSSSISND